MDDLTTQEIFELCNIDIANENFERSLVQTLIKENIPGQYRTEENDKFFKYWLENKYSLMGLRYLLYWQAQEGEWLSLASNFLFSLPRRIQGISLTDEELRVCCKFATVCLNLNACSVEQFFSAIYDTFGYDLRCMVDPATQTQTYFYNPEVVTLNMILLLNMSHLLPDLLGFHTEWIEGQTPRIYFRDVSETPDAYYINIDEYYNADGTPKENIQDIIDNTILPMYTVIRDITQEPYENYFFQWPDYGSFTFT